MKNPEVIERIYDTSLAMFLEKGYDKVRVSDICQAVMITKPTFYAYELSKEDLLNHAFEAGFDHMIVQPAGDSNRELMDAILGEEEKIITRAFTLGPSLVRSFLKNNINRPCLPIYWKEPWQSKMREMIETAQSRRIIRNPMPASRLLYTMNVVLLGYSFSFCTGSGSHLTIEKARRVLMTFMNVDCSKLEEGIG